MFVDETSLTDKRVLISGGTTGIGRATVMRLAHHGARIVTFGRHEPELETALSEVRQRVEGAEIYGLIADAATPEGIAAAFAEVDDKLGGLDIVVANAGLAAEGAQDMADDEWRYVVETNFLGYIATCREAIHRFEVSGAGHIVLIGSISAEARSPGTSVYAATKAGIEAYAKTLRKEVMGKNIKVTLIEPGAVGADMQDKNPEEQREAIARHEMLYAEELADTIAFALTRSVRTDISVMRVEPLIERT